MRTSTASSAGGFRAGWDPDDAERGVRAVVLSDASTERNGVGSYYADLVSQLRERGAEVELIAPDPNETTWRPYVPMPGDATQRVFLPPIPTIRRTVQEISPHVIVVPTPGPYGWFGCVLAKLVGARLAASFHTHYEKVSEAQSNPIARQIGVFGFSWAHHFMFQACDVVPTISARLAKVAAEIGARNIQLVGTPIAKRFLETPLKPMSPSFQRVMFAGRLSPEKNVEHVLHAAMELPEIEFEIVGDGPLRGEVERYSRVFPNLRYSGWVPRRRMPERMDAADLVVLPSQEVSFGTVVLEAMDRQRPVHVSHACGIRDWKGFRSALYAIRKNETLAQAIRRVARGRTEERFRKARRGRELACQLNEQSLNDWLGVLQPRPHPVPA